MTCLTLIIGFTAIFFTAQSVVDLQIAEILCGIPWGVFQTLTITYASEVCPVALRGYLTTYVNFCWGLGQVIGIGVIKSMLGRTDEWAYRVCAPFKYGMLILLLTKTRFLTLFNGCGQFLFSLECFSLPNPHGG